MHLTFRINMIFLFSFFLVPVTFGDIEQKDRIIKVPENVTELQIDYTFCGSDLTSRRASFRLMPPNYNYLEINHCCAIHDDCYDQQSGKTECDNEFYYCLANLYYMGHNLFYMAVYNFGKNAYTEAAKYIPIDVIQPTSNDTQFNELYLELYTACPKTRSTISSCALKFEICGNNKKNQCIEGMQNCLREIRARNNRKNEKCQFKLVSTLRAIKYAFDVEYYYDK